jgi:hypothetical protein
MVHSFILASFFSSVHFPHCLASHQLRADRQSASGNSEFMKSFELVDRCRKVLKDEMRIPRENIVL